MKLQPELLKVSGDAPAPSDTLTIIGLVALRERDDGVYEWWMIPIPSRGEVEVKLEGGVDRETAREIIRRILEKLE